MSNISLREGGQALYRSSLVNVRELIGHDEAAVSFTEAAAGTLVVKRSELLAITIPDAILRGTTIAEIPEQEWRRAEQRADVLRRLDPLKVGMSDAVTKAAAELEMSRRQLWRLLKSYRTHRTTSGLVAQTCGRKPGTRVLSIEVERIIGATADEIYLQLERPTIAVLQEHVNAACREQGLEPPCRKTLTRRIEAYRTLKAQKARLGAKTAKYLYEAMPGHVEVSAPLERVEIDHTPLDVFAMSDSPECGYVGRPWLTLAIDCYTRCIVGFYISFETPSVLSVAMCLTQCVLQKSPASEFGVPLDWPMYGCPIGIVVDNGKDFTSDAFRRGCHEHNIVLSYRPGRTPHYGGAIERLIGTMVGRCHMLPGTSKRSVKEKGEYQSEAKACMTLSEVRTWFVEQVLGAYHPREHRMMRIPPEVAWRRAMDEGATVRTPINPLEFLVTFLPSEERCLTRTGVELHCLQYWEDSLEQWVGRRERVRVHYDPRDISVAYVRTPVGVIVKAAVTTPGITAMSLAEWNARRCSERSQGRNPDSIAVRDASLKRSTALVEHAKANRRVRRRRATAAAGDRWSGAPAPVGDMGAALPAPANDALPVLCDTPSIMPWQEYDDVA